MFAFYNMCFNKRYLMASATAYGRRPKVVKAEHLASAESENCAYGPTLELKQKKCAKIHIFDLRHFLKNH